MSFIKDLNHDEIRDGWLVKTDKKKFWNREIEILQEVDSICREHEITYWAAYGTLLGAARHGGFIPWDWDVDICMMRPDFNRFYAIIEEELIRRGGLFEINHRDFSGLKISHSQTTSISIDNFNYEKPQGICIDIFALDIDSDNTRDGFFAFNALNELLCTIFSYPKIMEHVQKGKYTVNDLSVLEIMANKMTDAEK